jgi:predicted RNase H-like nuclease
VAELGYDVRPLYKRKPRKVAMGDWRQIRAAECDELISRIGALSSFDSPIDLRSQEVTRKLLDEPSPLADRPYKRREDLLDAAISAWTAACWQRYGSSRCAVLGAEDPADQDGRRATIIAPWREPDGAN